MHLDDGHSAGFYHGNALLQAGQAADFCNIALTLDAHLVISSLLDFLQELQHPLACPPVEAHGCLDVIDRQAGAQGNALRRDDIAQLAPLGALDLDIALGNQAFQVPVDSANRHTELSSQGCLGDVRVVFDLFQQDELADRVGLRFCSHIQNSVVEL